MKTHEGVSLNRGLQAGFENAGCEGRASKQGRRSESAANLTAPATQDKDAEKRLFCTAMESFTFLLVQTTNLCCGHSSLAKLREVSLLLHGLSLMKSFILQAFNQVLILLGFGIYFSTHNRIQRKVFDADDSLFLLKRLDLGTTVSAREY